MSRGWQVLIYLFIAGTRGHVALGIGMSERLISPAVPASLGPVSCRLAGALI